MNRLILVALLLVLLGVAACGGNEGSSVGARQGVPTAAAEADAPEVSARLSPQTKALRAVLAGTDRVRVRAAEAAGKQEPRVLPFDVVGGDAAWSLIRRIAFDDEVAEECECSGQLKFDFYQGTVLKATATYHHGVGLAAPTEGSTWRHELTPESQGLLYEWLIGRGLDDRVLRLDRRMHRRR